MTGNKAKHLLLVIHTTKTIHHYHPPPLTQNIFPPTPSTQNNAPLTPTHPKFTLSQSVINDLPDDVICDIAIYVDDTTLYSKCDLVSDLWQQLEFASELGSDVQDTDVDWGKKWLVDFSAGKTRLVSFDWSNNNGSIDVKMNGSALEEKSFFKMLELTFSSKLDWGSYIISIAKTLGL